MGNKLHKLGAGAFTHAWWVVGGWIVVIAVLAFTAVTFIKPTSSAVTIPGTEAQKALDRMSQLFPSAGKGTGRVVFAAPEGKTIDDFKQTISETTDKFSKVDGISQVADPYVNSAAISNDKTIAYTQLQLKDSSGSVSDATINSVQDIVSEARSSGLEVEVGGDIISKVPGEIIGVGEIGGLVVALLVLFLTLGALVAAGLPLITAVVSVIVSMAGLFSLSQVMTISSTTPVLAVMLGLAVGIDYSLFIINRYRTYILEGYEYKEAAARAIGTAGNAVIFAASTVVIALAALTVVRIPFITTMGLTAAASIVVAALVSITLIPAMLRITGRFIFKRKARAHIAELQKKGPKENHHASRTTFWYRWGAAVAKYPLPIVIVAVAALAVVALPVKDLKLGLPTDEYAATSSIERKAYDLLSKGFGAGFNGPLLVVAEHLPAVSEADKAAIREPAMDKLNQQIQEATSAQQAALRQQSAMVQTPEQGEALQKQIAQMQAQGEQQKAAAIAQIEASVTQYAKLVQLKKVADNIAKNDDVKSATPALATDDGTNGLIQVIPKSAPSDAATIKLITEIRNPDNQKEFTNGSSIDLSVTGSAALQNDINEKLSSVLPVYLAIVVGLSFILLVIAFRSILVPLKATLGFLLSVLAMFGAVVAVFQWGWFGIADSTGPIISFIPIISIGILFGLAMDYEFFLVTSMHEAYRETKDARRSVLRGFAHASKVVVAAAIIMVSVFAGFIGNHDATIQSIGFGLAFGILIDAFIVRMTIVPAVMVLLGDKAWWLPKWLDRILPHVSIEGEVDAKK